MIGFVSGGVAGAHPLATLYYPYRDTKRRLRRECMREDAVSHSLSFQPG
jgi:hypothetical protein